jgi:UDP:flavonoid glycosyltransferase YjiC (YdhE family)
MRVLFTTTPGRGHFYPMVPLAKAFRERGHDVAWAAAEHVCSELRDEGFDAIEAGPTADAAWAEFERHFLPQVQALPPPKRPDFMFPRLFGPLRAAPMLDDLLPIARDWQPSLLVSDQAELAGPIAAAALGIANVTHAFGSLLPPHRVADAGKQLAPLWEAQGLQPRPFAGTYDHLYLDIYPPSLQTADTEHLSAVQPLQPMTFAADGNDAAPDWLTGGLDAPLVYVTFGTVFNRDISPIATVVEAVRELPVRVVVTLGPGRDVGALGEQPSNVHVAGYIPQTQVLPHCAAVASHAGSGTFLAALARGLPQLLLPQAADQFLNATAAARAGVGIAIQPHELTVEVVRDALSRLLVEREFRDAAERLAQEIREMPGPGTVVESIERRFETTGASRTANRPKP